MRNSFGPYVPGVIQSRGDIDRPVVSDYFPPVSKFFGVYGNIRDRHYNNPLKYLFEQEKPSYGSSDSEDKGVIELSGLPKFGMAA